MHAGPGLLGIAGRLRNLGDQDPVFDGVQVHTLEDLVEPLVHQELGVVHLALELGAHPPSAKPNFSARFRSGSAA